MSLELLEPISEEALNHTHLMPRHVLGNAILRHTRAEGMPELGTVQIALIGVHENRNAYFPTLSYDITAFRKAFYSLYPGNWNVQIADLGDLPNGQTAEDTYFALHEISFQLRQLNILPVIIGGSNDLVYPLYRSYQKNNQFINMVSIDNQFDFSQDEELISGRSYMSQIIMEQPNLLKHFANIGYQAFYIAQEELDLMDKLSFDAVRLGVVLDDVKEAEPYIRDADLVGIDMKVLSAVAAGNYTNGQPNGIDSRTICALARYAGICDRVSTFGLFELHNSPIFHQLLAQIIWYFCEGFSCRFGEYPVATSTGFIKYTVQLSHQELIFWKSEKSGRWWIELRDENYFDNKTKSSTLLPCTQKDYLDACQDSLPERWLQAFRKGI